MTFKERLLLWGFGLFLIIPFLLLPLLGKGGLVLDVIASAMLLAAVLGLGYLIRAMTAPGRSHKRIVRR